MNAHEFVKQHGLDGAKYFLDLPCYSINQLAMLESGLSCDDLKRLVESHELVAIHGYARSKSIVADAPSDDHYYSWVLGDSGVYDKTVNIGELRKAIADVEACQ